jgi:hypothetical protein
VLDPPPIKDIQGDADQVISRPGSHECQGWILLQQRPENQSQVFAGAVLAGLKAEALGFDQSGTGRSDKDGFEFIGQALGRRQRHSLGAIELAAV